MKQPLLFSIVLLSVIIYASCSQYSRGYRFDVSDYAQTLQLKGTYDALYEVEAILDTQINLLQTAISEFESAVAVALIKRDEAGVALDVASANEAKAKALLNAAKLALDNKNTEIATAKLQLTASQNVLNAAIAEASAAASDYSYKLGLFTAVCN
jgi:hypothetical protein